MLLTSASPTPYDVRFRLFGFPVRISPVFWIIALLLGGAGPPDEALIWVAAVLVSILVHDLDTRFSNAGSEASRRSRSTRSVVSLRRAACVTFGGATS